MEEQVLKRVEFSAENESGSEELERYVLELESQIRNMKAELDELRPLSRMAVVDSLTGLSNRYYFDTRSSVEQKRLLGDSTYSLAVFVLDLDNLKVINDTFGHDVGDRALQGVARSIKKLLRTSDACCRVGGDEFVVIAGDCERESCERLAKRLRTVVSRVEGPWETGTLRVSVGYATSSEDGVDMSTLVALADERMYEDKWNYKRSLPWQQLFRAHNGTETAFTRVLVNSWTWATQTMVSRSEILMNRAMTFGRGL